MIKLNEGYMLQEINHIPYLLPYGQNIADFRHSIRLNESGRFLYRALSNGADEKELLSLLSSCYHVNHSDIPALKEDINLFLLQLKTAGILSFTSDLEPPVAGCGDTGFAGQKNSASALDTSDTKSSASALDAADTKIASPLPGITDMPDCYLHIGPLVSAYYGPKELLYPSLSDFSCKNTKPDIHFRIIPAVPSATAKADILIRTEELTICRNKTSYLLLYPKAYGITEAHISLDGKWADFFCPRPFDEELPEKLFHAFRFAYLISAQKKGAFALHSASILYKNKAWLFSGPSGTGKSTHTTLWQEQYQTPYLNGDLNLISFAEDMPVVYGIPWCGTSDLYTTKNIPLGGIVFLKQAHTDSLLPLPKEDATLHVLQRTISPAWTEDMLLLNLAFAEKLNGAVPLFYLQCTKEKSAVQVVKQAIDTVL